MAAGLWLVFRDHGYDDPYITFRYARNLAQGLGLVYNPGERVLSTTAPLYALMLAPAAWLGLPLPAFANAVGCGALGAGALALWRLGRAWGTPLAGGVAALAYPLIPGLIETLGGETTLVLALILWGVDAWARGRELRCAALLAVATLVRADAALAMAVCGLAAAAGRAGPDWRAWAGRLPAIVPWQMAGLYLLLVLPPAAAAWAYYGSPLPATLAAKQLQGQMVASRSFGAGLAGILIAYSGLWLYWPTLALSALGALAAWRYPRWLPVLGWVAAYTLAYIALGVSAYFWYYAPVFAGWAVLAGLGAEALVGAARRAGGGRAAAAATALTLAGVALLAGAAQLRAQYPDTRLGIYRAVGEWLREQAPAGAAVGSLEVGVIGYYAERPVVDFAGLIQPDVARVLGPSASYLDAARYAVARYRPAYLAFVAGTLTPVEEGEAVASACDLAATISDEAFPAPVRIYRCAW